MTATRSYVVSAGRRICYESGGDGPALLLHHGFTSNAQAWRVFGFTDVLRQHCRVIALDALGHGDSDKPHETHAYTLRQRSADVLAVLDALQIDKVHYFGYSMGGWVGYGLVRHARHRLQSLILGATHPYADRSWDAFQGLDGSDPNAFIAAFETVLDERIPPEVKMLVRANDLTALAAAAQQPRASLEALLPLMDMPCLMFCGDADARHDAVKRSAAQLPRACFISLPGVTHFGGLMQSRQVLPPVIEFLAAQTPMPFKVGLRDQENRRLPPDSTV